MLDQLERDAVAELQLELAALLAERTQMQETRGRETVERWCALLRIARTTPVEQAVEQAAELEDEQAELAREVLFENQRKLAAVRASMLSGMPSDERSELVHSMWENAVLRAEVHACQQALGACQTQLSELAAVSQAAGWEPRATASLLTELSVEAAAARSESEETIASLAQPFGVDGKADVPSGRAGHLAQLVPALLRHNASRFGQVIRDARAMLAHHRREPPPHERLPADPAAREASPRAGHPLRPAARRVGADGVRPASTAPAGIRDLPARTPDWP